MLVVAGGEAMEREARRLIETFRGVPYIFNLGHGLTPDTPPENVGRLVEIIRSNG
jgi:uroporphyrinogen decarboxylase